MLLSELKKYIRLKRSQSLFEISKNLDIAADVLQDMLHLLVRKGQVRVCKKTSACGTRCSKCSLSEMEVYEWVGG
ncbi:MAG: FeoC like transcriptional regulator [Gammaproteobacteria bacterium]|jgi:hypothetical protein|nr:FeoC like transcriptional regulator [Gammaproteobacteria bacterium]